MTQPGLGGGLVPHQVVADLQDIGNWKVWYSPYAAPIVYALHLCMGLPDGSMTSTLDTEEEE